ncbi:MAG: HYR domain-containing protein, partial [Candidatus Eisenbacteria bacterium]|nr:HYR domain-containing protein [Candidatus Eisenbacteria bacterium]
MYALLRPQGVLTGDGGFIALEQKAVEDDIKNGAISASSAAEALAATSAIEGTVSSAPMVTRAFTQKEQRMNELLGAPALGYAAQLNTQASAGGSITVQGTVQWTDENGVTHPVWGANVDIYDEDLIVDDYLTTVATDVAGNYVAVVPNDDGIGAGDADIYVVVRAENTWIRTETTGNSVYAFTSQVWDETPSGTTLNYSPTAANTGTGPSMSMFQSGTWIAGYVALDVEAAALAQVNLVWPNGGDGSFYDGEVQIEQDDRWDWDTVHHEYGHYAMDVLNIENNPGGPHGIGDCIAQVRGEKNEGNRLAWGEGWPTYFGTTGQAEMNMASLNVPRVGDVSYQDLEDTNLIYSLETQDNNGRGEDNEVSVQRLLWDLYDTNSDGRDAISLSDNTIWDAVKAAAGSPHILSTYWQGLVSGQSAQNQILMGEIATDHLIGPSLNVPGENLIISPSNSFLNWDALVGCPSSYSGDTFDVVFFDANTFATILTIPGLNANSHNLTNGQIATIIASTHDVLWGVRGYHLGDTLPTGPYLGETFAATVNRPPVADAGPDQTVECESHTTTTVQMDGSGSSDPDGDPLTYAWSATGVTFSNANAQSPTGEFPKGTTVVTLVVSDGIQEDSDQVSITIEDTTPPVITCPDPITVECTEAGGTSKDDPQLIPFFDGVSATDICDDNPVITNNAPDLFALGVTTVTFYATDADDNVDSCMVDVTVEDTTPPEITVELDRNVLWPPNHKMVPIAATVEVTDICDPNPTFVLTSITSNEADNGIGDGNTDDDIDAEFGTPDVDFELRAERKGNGDGRKYTIIYTAMDMSGNTAPDTVCVTVPHDQSGNAAALAGFIPSGTSLIPDASEFEIVIPSSGDVRPEDIDPKQVYLGNQLAVFRPAVWSLQYLDGDDELDLVVRFGVDQLTTILETGISRVGLHYTGNPGEDFLMSDVFAMGPRFEPQLNGGSSEEREVSNRERVRALESEEPDKPEIAGLAGPGVLRLAQGGFVTAEVFDVLGRKVRLTNSRHLSAGVHDLRWDGRDSSGRNVPNGIYFYRLVTPEGNQVHKIAIAR